MQLTALSPFNSKLDCPDITIYDSTLRDGEQMPGVAFSPAQKLDIALMLDEIGIPQIEAGFPAVSESEFNSIKSIASEGLDADILALSRLKKGDIDAAVESGVDMILLFIATSDLHLKYKLEKTRECIKEMTVDSIEYCKDRGVEISFSSEDSTRTDLDFLLEIFELAEDAGAHRLGLTDTVGCASPEAISRLVSEVTTRLKSPVSIHLHNDFGMALPNAIAAVKGGARAITTTVNGMGERSGNLALEQFVSAMKYLYDMDLGLDTTKFKELSEVVAKFAGHVLSQNHPLVGDNTFSHESGIHVAAVLRCPLTYESIPPSSLGQKRKLRMGKHTGITYIRNRLEELEVEVTEEDICEILFKVKAMGEAGGIVNDKEFKTIVEQVVSGQ